MSFKELIRRINHRQSLENSVCSESCLTCEKFDECYEFSVEDEEEPYDEVPIGWTYFTVFFSFLWAASFIGFGIYGLVSFFISL